MPKRYAVRPIDQRGERNLARRVEGLRKSRGWSFETLAKAMTEAGCTISKAAVYNIEEGDPPRRITVNELIALAQIFTDGDVAELLKPKELADREWAEGVAESLRDAVDRLDEAYADTVRAALQLADIAAEDPDLAEFVGHQWTATAPGRQWFAEFIDEVDGATLMNIASRGEDFWESVLGMVDSKINKGE